MGSSLDIELPSSRVHDMTMNAFPACCVSGAVHFRTVVEIQDAVRSVGIITIVTSMKRENSGGRPAQAAACSVPMTGGLIHNPQRHASYHYLALSYYTDFD